MSAKESNRKNRRRRRVRRGTQGYGLVNNRGYTQTARPAWSFLDPHQYLTFKYNESLVFTIATVTGTQQIWRINSLFDPNNTGTGHQPYGFDQLANLYNRYRVLRVRWKLIFGSTTVTYQALVVPVNGTLSSAISNATTFDAAAEIPRAKAIIVSANAPAVTVSGSMALNELNGVTRTEYLADDRFEAQVGASPAELINLYMGWYNGSGGTITVAYNAELEFLVDMHDPVIATQSFNKKKPVEEKRLSQELVKLPPGFKIVRE